jgi:hypothetical protein
MMTDKVAEHGVDTDEPSRSRSAIAGEDGRIEYSENGEEVGFVW